MDQLEALLAQSAELHHHLCPRQVLGVRMALYAGLLLSVEVPQQRKRLLTFVETDGCFADGVAVAANCWVGRRTMRVVDYGKTAATFVDTKTERALRILPSQTARTEAGRYARDAANRWQTYLLGYQRMPVEALFEAQEVQLCTPVVDLISRPGIRVNCEICSEEIINEREVVRAGRVLCRSCAGENYYFRPACEPAHRLTPAASDVAASPSLHAVAQTAEQELV